MGVFKTMGRALWQFHEPVSGKGRHSVDITATGLVPGTYIVKMILKNKQGNEAITSTAKCLIVSR